MIPNKEERAKQTRSSLLGIFVFKGGFIGFKGKQGAALLLKAIECPAGDAFMDGSVHDTACGGAKWPGRFLKKPNRQQGVPLMDDDPTVLNPRCFRSQVGSKYSQKHAQEREAEAAREAEAEKERIRKEQERKVRNSLKKSG